jgi:hypothetical protein
MCPWGFCTNPQNAKKLPGPKGELLSDIAIRGLQGTPFCLRHVSRRASAVEA